MPTAILNLVKLNDKIDYTFLIPLVILYFLIFWVLVSIWVYIDTKKRVKRKRFRILIFLLNLVFGLPFMLLYLLARPYDNEEIEEINGGGVNVPVINFIGKEGIVMALELKILPSNLINKDMIYDASMKIGVNIETPQSAEIQKIELPLTESVGKVDPSEPIIEKGKKKTGLTNFFKNLFEFKGEEEKNDQKEKELSDVEKQNTKKSKKKFNKKRNR